MLCRICIQDIESENSLNIEKHEKFKHLISMHLHLELASESNGSEIVICNDCLTQLKDFNEFYRKIQTSQISLLHRKTIKMNPENLQTANLRENANQLGDNQQELIKVEDVSECIQNIFGSTTQEIFSFKEKNSDRNTLKRMILNDQNESDIDAHLIKGSIRKKPRLDSEYVIKANFDALEKKIKESNEKHLILKNAYDETNKTVKSLSLKLDVIMKKLFEAEEYKLVNSASALSTRAKFLEKSPTFSKVSTIEELDEFEKNLSDENFLNSVISEMKTVCGYRCRKKDGVNCCYELIDYIFERKVFVHCSWTGFSKMGTKVCLQSYKNVLNCFYQIIRLSDEEFSIQNLNKFFTIILKNSKRRAATTDSIARRASKAKCRNVARKSVINKIEIKSNKEDTTKLS